MNSTLRARRRGAVPEIVRPQRSQLVRVELRQGEAADGYKALRALASGKNAKPRSTKDMERALAPLRFVPVAAPFIDDPDSTQAIGKDARLPNQEPHGRALLHEGVLDFRSDHVPVDSVIFGSSIMRIAAQPNIFKDALELSMARDVRRPILRGVRDFEAVEITALASWRRSMSETIMHPLTFDRSARGLRSIGVHHFSILPRTVARVFRAGLAFGFSRLVGEDQQTTAEQLASIGGGYFVSGDRTLHDLKNFSQGSAANGAFHLGVSVAATPIYVHVLQLLLAGSMPFSMNVAYAFGLYALNTYAGFAQALHRTRLLNTIDMKMGTGRFTQYRDGLIENP